VAGIEDARRPVELASAGEAYEGEEDRWSKTSLIVTGIARVF
jgi:hypothetical protein